MLPELHDRYASVPENFRTTTLVANTRSFQMRIFSLFATAVALLMCLPAGTLFAQTTNTGTETAPAATPTAPPPPPPPAATTAPATTTTTTTTSTPASTEKDSGTKKKKSSQTTTRQEVQKSIESGTVPSRYR